MILGLSQGVSYLFEKGFAGVFLPFRKVLLGVLLGFSGFCCGFPGVLLGLGFVRFSGFAQGFLAFS